MAFPFISILPGHLTAFPQSWVVLPKSLGTSLHHFSHGSLLPHNVKDRRIGYRDECKMKNLKNLNVKTTSHHTNQYKSFIIFTSRILCLYSFFFEISSTKFWTVEAYHESIQRVIQISLIAHFRKWTMSTADKNVPGTLESALLKSDSLRLSSGFSKACTKLHPTIQKTQKAQCQRYCSKVQNCRILKENLTPNSVNLALKGTKPSVSLSFPTQSTSFSIHSSDVKKFQMQSLKWISHHKFWDSNRKHNDFKM